MTKPDARTDRPAIRIQFKAGTDMVLVEDTVALAILTIGCLHGEAAVRLEAGYAIDADKRVVVLEAGTPLSIDVARAFVGLATREFGAEAFEIDTRPRRSAPSEQGEKGAGDHG